jgi:hypothetical protein
MTQRHWKIHTPLIHLVCAVLLFQFFAPAFLNNSIDRHETTVTVHKSYEGIRFPVLLKEKDETESREGRHHVFSLPILIDFSYAVFALTLTHELKFQLATHDDRVNYYPSLHTLFCIFLI